MPELHVVNTSPLIFLSHGGLLELLQLLSPRILVPRPVADEIRQLGRTDRTVQALDATPWLEIVETASPSPEILAWDLGPGETSVLTYCLANSGSRAILDDLAARNCAQTFGIPVIGTLGLVLMAKEVGAIPAARSVLEAMRSAGMYLSDRVLDRALRTIGE